ncbi:hypothetical protein BUL40_15630 [Croceivirga radicis]|uniref:Uncharacterized protein n=1 Tax=Croceivirga radicis TaxID=1929488 RepID=A0A1V6LNA6_9FLAO|nr:hypothetical protein [Croceivirga radicis]OQD41507.1 hypothetical protein BUL40_15630 [Croceivirga radicis]
MIDFTFCEIEKAFKGLYSDNEVISITPIIKGANEPFSFNPKTVYYGKFANIADASTLLYKLTEIEKGVEDILFTRAESLVYDSFTGYRVQLKNSLEDFKPKPKVSIYFDFTHSDGHPAHTTLNGAPIVQGHNIFEMDEVIGQTLVNVSHNYGLTLTPEYSDEQTLLISLSDMTFNSGLNRYQLVVYAWGEPEPVQDKDVVIVMDFQQANGFGQMININGIPLEAGNNTVPLSVVLNNPVVTLDGSVGVSLSQQFGTQETSLQLLESDLAYLSFSDSYQVTLYVIGVS